MKGYIYSVITKSAFRDAFKRMGREENYTYNGLGALYDCLVEWSEESGMPLELDVLGLCTEWSEYGSAWELATDYGIERESGEDDEEFEARVLAETGNESTVVPFDGGWLVGP